MLVPVLREGVTNILPHSNASHCAIEMTATAGLLRLQLSNDRSIESPTETGRAGNGLANLAARVEAAGGRVTSGRADGRFNLVAEIPTPPVTPRGGLADRPAGL